MNTLPSGHLTTYDSNPHFDPVHASCNPYFEAQTLTNRIRYQGSRISSLQIPGKRLAAIFRQAMRAWTSKLTLHPTCEKHLSVAMKWNKMFSVSSKKRNITQMLMPPSVCGINWYLPVNPEMHEKYCFTNWVRLYPLPSLHACDHLLHRYLSQETSCCVFEICVFYLTSDMCCQYRAIRGMGRFINATTGWAVRVMCSQSLAAEVHRNRYQSANMLISQQRYKCTHAYIQVSLFTCTRKKPKGVGFRVQCGRSHGPSPQDSTLICANPYGTQIWEKPCDYIAVAVYNASLPHTFGENWNIHRFGVWILA